MAIKILMAISLLGILFWIIIQQIPPVKGDTTLLGTDYKAVQISWGEDQGGRYYTETIKYKD